MRIQVNDGNERHPGLKCDSGRATCKLRGDRV